MPILGSDDNLAPAYVIQVGERFLEIGVTNAIVECSYESADGMADVAKLKVMNPDFKISDAKVFQPGNEIAMWMGYGNNLAFIGRAVIDKVRANFPKGDSMPMMEVVGYTRDHEMMQNAPQDVKRASGAALKKLTASPNVKKKRKRKGVSGRVFAKTSMSDVVKARLEDYGFVTHIDPTPEFVKDVIQKAGMNDYEFVTGMANIAGYVFWVEGDENGEWSAYFLNPNGEILPLLQDKKYTFEYNTQLATLLSFEPEQIFTDNITKLTYELHNPRNGKVEKAEFDAEDKKFDTLVQMLDETEPVDGEQADGAQIKLYIGDYSIEVASGKSFKSLAEFEAWAAAWFRRNRGNFITARGEMIGLETLKARQTHSIAGVGTFYSGDYYFSRVRHSMSARNGFRTDFHARKIIG